MSCLTDFIGTMQVLPTHITDFGDSDFWGSQIASCRMESPFAHEGCIP